MSGSLAFVNYTFGRDCELFVSNCVCLPQILMSVKGERRCVEPIRSVETRSGHTRVITLSHAVLVTSLTTKAAAAKVTFGLVKSIIVIQVKSSSL